MALPLIQFSESGLYCPQGQFYIDPWKPVEKAVITHAHSDHARPGSRSYFCHRDSLALLQLRLGPNQYQTAEWNEPVYLNGVKLSLHPAGHVIGSSQVRLEYQGEVWVVSGDYKTEDDGLSGTFQPIRCDVFITESTFGLPVYNWKPQEEIYQAICDWVLDTRNRGRTPVLLAYSLGKAQRVISCIAQTGLPILLHGAIHNVQQALTGAGHHFPETQRIVPDMPKELLRAGVVIAPSSVEGSSWLKRMGPYSLGICSGWMQVRGHFRRRNADAGFALSDHADWNGLIQAVKETGASKVFATHGFQAAFSRYLNETGVEAAEVKTEYGLEEDAGNADS